MQNVSASRRRTSSALSLNVLNENLILTAVPVLLNKVCGPRLKQSGSAVNAALPAIMRNCPNKVAMRVVR